MPNFVLAVSIMFAAIDLLAIISVLRLRLRSIKSIAIPILRYYTTDCSSLMGARSTRDRDDDIRRFSFALPITFAAFAKGHSSSLKERRLLETHLISGHVISLTRSPRLSMT